MKVVTYNNILAPLERSTQVVDATTAYEALNKLHIDTDLYDVVVSRNQVVTEGDFELLDGDCVAISLVPLGGGGDNKNVIRTVALIAVMVAAPLLAPSLLIGIGQFAVIDYGVTSLAMASLAISAAGSYLVNAVLPPQTPSLNTDVGSNLDSSPTYSWDVHGNQIKQGVPVPMLYGKHRVTPPQISHYVETIDNQQYLNILYAVADGDTNIDTASIKINDDDIDSLTDVTVYTRRGLNDQSIIGVFDDVRSDKSVNKKLTTDWVYSTTSGNSVSGIEVGIVAPQGIWQVNNSGNFIDYTVKVEVQYQYGAQWVPIAQSQKVELTNTVLGYWAKGGYQKYAKFSTLEDAMQAAYFGNYTGTYDSTSIPSNTIPATYTNPHPARGSTEVVLDKVWAELETYTITNPYDIITSKKQEALRRSYKVSGLPEGSYQVRARFYEEPVTGTKYGSTVYFSYLQETVTDDFTYPNTSLLGIRILATDQLSGSMPVLSVIAENSMNNPANVCKDILEKSGESLSALEISKFDEWEQQCIDKSYTCNIYFDSIFTVRKALDLVGLLGRGNVIQYGSKWSVIIDKADETPVQGFLFTMGNIAKDSFSEQFLPMQDRANKVEITYYDETVDYTPQILEVSNTNYDNVDNVNSTAITYVGCTNKDMALNYAKFLLNCGRYLTITQTFEVDTEALVCRVGDIIKVAHDVPQIGLTSGRIITASTTEVTIDSEVTLDAGEEYYIEFRYSDTDEIVSESVVNSQTTTDTFVFTTPITNVPSKYDVFSFGTVGKVSKKMRVISITNTSKQRSKITALEYVPEVYDDVENIIPHSSSSFGITGLSLNESITYVGTSVVSNIEASWRGSSLWYDVYLDDVLYSRVYNDSVKIENVTAPATHTIIIKDSNAGEVTDSISLLGKLIPPNDVTGFVANVVKDNVILSWNKVEDGDLAGYELTVNDVVYNEGLSGTTFSIKPTVQHYDFKIRAIDNSGVFSENYSLVSLDILPPTVTSFTTEVVKNNVVLHWQGQQGSLPIVGYQLTVNDVVYNEGLSGTTFAIKPTEDVYNFKLKAIDSSGFLSDSFIATDKNIVLPSVTGFYAEFVNGNIIVHWQGVQGTLPINGYELTINGIVYDEGLSGTTFTLKPTETHYDFKIQAVDTSNFYSMYSTTSLDVVLPSMLNFSYEIVKNNIVLHWQGKQGSLPIAGYKLLVDDVPYNEGVNGTTFVVKPVKDTYNLKIKSIDTSGFMSSSYTPITVNLERPTITSIYTEIVNDNIVLRWQGQQGSLPISGYELTINDVLYNEGLSGTTFTLKPTEDYYEFKMRAIDTSGLLSDDYVMTNISVTPPEVSNFYAEVIDNNVLLRWLSVPGTLPIASYQVFKGTDFATSELIGSKNGTFTVVFERESGNFTYWVQAVDTAGVAGEAKSLYTSVSQPPDYILNVDWSSDFTGSTNNTLLKKGKLYLLPNTTETWQEHFVNNTYTTPQDQINAGLPYYVQPTKATGSYQEVFDYGTVLAATQINVAPTVVQSSGVISYTIDIETSLDNSTWTTYTDVSNVYATNFRYVRVTVHFSTNNGVGYMSELNVRLDSKIINDAGSVTANASDTDGTVVTFNKAFVDITSITLAPNSTSAVTPVYDFTDVPNPTQFKVYLFDNTGARVSGEVSWAIKGY